MTEITDQQQPQAGEVDLEAIRSRYDDLCRGPHRIELSDWVDFSDVPTLLTTVARQAEQIAGLRDLLRTAHDNADYIVSMLKSESEAVSFWPQTRHAVLLLKAEAIMALEAAGAGP